MTGKKKTAVEEIMEKSGNGFHSRVVNLLRHQEWIALVSPYYSDNFTDKPREIDIIARKEFDVNEYLNDHLGELNIELFIECKYINGDTIFWFDNKNISRAIERTMVDTGMEHPRKNTRIMQLHYLDDVPVAKLFSSEKSRNEDSELMNKAINQNLNALVYYRGRNDIFPKDPRNSNVLRRVPYPIIVVNSFDHFYCTNMDDGTEKVEQITEPFQLEINYAYVDKDRVGRNEYFLIDVVSIDMLEKFLLMLENKNISVIKQVLAEDEGQKRRNREQNIKSMNINPAR
ncbi:MAG: hypothetical protein WC791_00525 [Candidatus Paceibacterota bacterium]|jgi:hypothetical protein